MNKKYELLESESNGLCRIKALRDFSDVKCGDIGGYVQGEDNLSHDGDCWIYNNSKVYLLSKISDNVKVYGGAEVCYATISGDVEIYGVVQSAWVFWKDEVSWKTCP